MYNYLYQITNLLNNKIYIGVHKTSDLNDGYMGSGRVIKSAIKKYGLNNFKKEILEYFDTYDLALQKETEIVTEDFLNRPDVYNLRRGGRGGFDYINNHTNKTDWAAAGGKKTSLLGKNFKDKATQEKALINSRENRIKTLNFINGSRDLSEKRKQKIRESVANPTYKNSQKGTCWITRDGLNKKIKLEELDFFIISGWSRGRVL